MISNTHIFSVSKINTRTKKTGNVRPSVFGFDDNDDDDTIKTACASIRNSSTKREIKGVRFPNLILPSSEKQCCFLVYLYSNSCNEIVESVSTFTHISF